MFSGILAELEKNLKTLPGIGPKTAQRLAIFLISMEKDKSLQIADSITEAVNSYHNCSECNILTEEDPCKFCSAPERDSNSLCIVETTQDVYLIENTHEFQGKYFVLTKLLSPLDGIGPNDIHFSQLIQKVKNDNIREIVLALNPSAEGETTIVFLATNLKDLVPSITRLSTGIPFGGDIEYSSTPTLINALKRRYTVKD